LNILPKASIKIIGALVLMGLIVTSCGPGTQRKPIKREKKPSKTDTLSVFFTGNALGALKPCGCSGGQLGGLERRPAVLNMAQKQKRLIIDTGSLVENDSEQDLIKFNILIQAFSLLDYDLVNLTSKDIEIAESLGLLDNPVIRFISPFEAGEKIAGGLQTQYLLNGEDITISVQTCDPETSSIEQIREIFPPRKPGRKSVNILIVNRSDSATISSIAKIGNVDCLVCPSESDEPMLIGDTNKRPLVFSVGRFGRYICEVQIKETSGTGDKLKLSFQAIKVEENLPQEGSLIKLYKDYQQLIRDRDLLEKYPRFVLPDGLEYSGSQSCKVCHEYEYDKWQSTAHARAYATLEQVGSQFDPECIVCHVIGMEYEGGFVSEEKTGHLKNVGCENCHGPGWKHISTIGTTKLNEPKSACADCHTPEHSGDYAGNEQTFLKKIIHWKEPNAAGNVK